MNSKSPKPNPSPYDDAVMKKLRSYRWKGRALTTAALSIGLLSVVASIALMWANSAFLFPQVQLLVQNSAGTQSANTNSIAQTNQGSMPVLTDGKTLDRQVLVTLLLGKAMWVTSRAVALLGLGTLLTLLLVIFNRQVTLRQINANLTQISNQIRQLQNSKSPDAGH